MTPESRVSEDTCETKFNDKNECEQWHLFTQDGIKVLFVAPNALRIDIAGQVVTKPLRDWHALAWQQNEALRSQAPAPGVALNIEQVRDALRYAVVNAGAENLRHKCHQRICEAYEMLDWQPCPAAPAKEAAVCKTCGGLGWRMIDIVTGRSPKADERSYGAERKPCPDCAPKAEPQSAVTEPWFDQVWLGMLRTAADHVAPIYRGTLLRAYDYIAAALRAQGGGK